MSVKIEIAPASVFGTHNALPAAIELTTLCRGDNMIFLSELGWINKPNWQVWLSEIGQFQSLSSENDRVMRAVRPPALRREKAVVIADAISTMTHAANEALSFELIIPPGGSVFITFGYGHLTVHAGETEATVMVGKDTQVRVDVARLEWGSLHLAVNFIPLPYADKVWVSGTMLDIRQLIDPAKSLIPSKVRIVANPHCGIRVFRARFSQGQLFLPNYDVAAGIATTPRYVAFEAYPPLPLFSNIAGLFVPPVSEIVPRVIRKVNAIHANVQPRVGTWTELGGVLSGSVGEDGCEFISTQSLADNTAVKVTLTKGSNTLSFEGIVTSSEQERSGEVHRDIYRVRFTHISKVLNSFSPYSMSPQQLNIIDAVKVGALLSGWSEDIAVIADGSGIIKIEDITPDFKSLADWLDLCTRAINSDWQPLWDGTGRVSIPSLRQHRGTIDTRDTEKITVNFVKVDDVLSPNVVVSPWGLWVHGQRIRNEGLRIHTPQAHTGDLTVFGQRVSLTIADFIVLRRNDTLTLILPDGLSKSGVISNVRYRFETPGVIFTEAEVILT